MKAHLKRKQEEGFTLIELVLVIAILGVLAVVALPNFFSISLTNARTNAMNATAGAVQAGLSLYSASRIANGQPEAYPALLEATDLVDGTAASNTNMLFNQILKNGVNAQWFKINDTCYGFDTNGNGTLDNGTGDTEFQYNSANGTFLSVANCG